MYYLVVNGTRADDPFPVNDGRKLSVKEVNVSGTHEIHIYDERNGTLVGSGTSPISLSTTTTRDCNEVDARIAKGGNEIRVRAEGYGADAHFETTTNTTTENVSTSVETVSVVVSPSAGAGDIDLSQATVEYLSSDARRTLTHTSGSPNATTFATRALRDSDPILSDSADRTVLRLNATKIEGGGAGLVPSETVRLRIVGRSGAVTVVTLDVPDVLTTESAVSL
ncbi:hypothetical protein [Halorussus litoreus]|uniref:hypothetical protein n=1 Tax=Halorussus litoreus TaxID=1710536 RepID=UPI0013007B67|nr:hypothetical protein [Halorussus litoreus]